MTVTMNGREIAVREVWVCACSGGHFEVGEDGSADAKCARKGGGWESQVVDAVTGAVVAVEMDADTVARMAEWGWRDVGGGFAVR